MEVGPRQASIGFVSTYPPTVCGLATFTASLIDGIARDRGSRSGLEVVSLTDGHLTTRPQGVVSGHRVGDGPSLDAATRILNSYDAVSIQHEFGIFAGPDGDEVMRLVAGLTVPLAVTFHTVLEFPTAHQRHIVDGLAREADRIVVMSETASGRLIRCYGIDPGHIEVIPHGVDALLAAPSLVSGERPLVLTWGLIGPGKGLESAIEAFGWLTDLDPAPRYLIAGSTHPNVRAVSGESYREGLISLVNHLGLDDIVEFEDRYFDRPTLARMVRSADLVVLPYESVEQVTSGVLVEAIAAAKPVVATRFPHAVELLAGGAGVTVPHDEPGALGAAVRDLLTDRQKMTGMGRVARSLADGWYWPTIGRRFSTMVSALVDADRAHGQQPTLEVRRVAG
ncbi:glycosyltransferase [soil metagenome]